MNWKFWSKKRTPEPVVVEHEDPFANSPFNADVITQDDPAWAIFEKAMATGGPVVGTYDGDTGEIVSIETVDSWLARHDALDDVQNSMLSTKPEDERDDEDRADAR